MNHILKGKLKNKDIYLYQKDTEINNTVTDNHQKVHFPPSVNE